ncbi:MAG: bifunctional alpha,alpha-trehalose-phosphate synthase (UDP-forming)/trehalose-phosphatase [Cyclobacteriaceae bacterium]|nr:bifunctional alpha,alpha-trehalose-phosphate synthase (UDP-forming)/trehalose-phosphatase [Cyclobacteriaceae bacterium]
MGKTIIVSNRLPVKVFREDDTIYYMPSEGGLATGLGSIYKNGKNLWIGWPGKHIKNESARTKIAEELLTEKMVPVFLSKKLIEEFYEGFSNDCIWPIFHYFLQYANFSHEYYHAYEKANKLFCDTIVKNMEPDDIVWIHDYQLLLLPQMIRNKFPNAKIGFFQHIPFPSYEVFRMIPWRKELLRGVLGADLIGFHTYDDMRHFLSAVSRLAGIPNNRGRIETGDRIIEVDSFPMGIDYQKYAMAAASPRTIDYEIRLRASLGKQKLILSIDRLDYSKGLPQRLQAFELFLNRHPEYHELVSLIMVVVPSRDNVAQYKELKQEVDVLVGRINGTYGKINWTPVHYFYRSFGLNELSAFYRMAHVALVTPLRDGMNLVCKEYIASKLEKTGVLILSEMAGASKELSDALLINPNNVSEMADAIYNALTMPEEAQIVHISLMQATLKRYNIHHWYGIFMNRLNHVINLQHSMETSRFDLMTRGIIFEKFKRAKKRLLFLDYDGTLIGFFTDPNAAKPDQALIQILKKLASDDRNKVIIISGRDKGTLDHWLGHLPINIVAEHGVWLRMKKGNWESMAHLQGAWKSEFKQVLETYVDRTPGSFIEEKDYSLVWHFRKVEAGLGELRSRELTSHLKYLTTGKNLNVLEGDMVVELKNADVNKGIAAQRWLGKRDAGFVMAIGDDWTDEDTFKAMPENSLTIKVGSTTSTAKYSLPSVKEVRELLKSLAEL